MRLHIIDLKDAFSSFAIRTVSEYFGFSTELALVGNSQILVDLLGTKKHFELLLINGHGVNGEFQLPPLADEIKQHFPFDSKLSANELGSFMNIDALCVLCTCCSTGSEEMAEVFLSNGAKHFVAPDGYPDGSDALKFVCDFLYWYGVKRHCSEEAFSLARTTGNDSSMFKCWTSTETNFA